MNKTLSQLKKDIKTGTQLKVIYHGTRPELQGNIKTVSRTQTNGFYTTCENDQGGREIWLDYPSASLVDYKDNQFTFYFIGERQLNDNETAFIEERNKIWAKNIYSNTYFLELALAKKMNVDYMVNSKPQKWYNHNNNTVFDAAIRGEKLITFEILKEK